MATNKVWQVMFVAGNPNKFSKVRVIPQGPFLRSVALEKVKVVENNNWRGWVEHVLTGERIYETQLEKEHNA